MKKREALSFKEDDNYHVPDTTVTPHRPLMLRAASQQVMLQSG